MSCQLSHSKTIPPISELEANNIAFIITGFGPFGEVTLNPTSEIIRILQQLDSKLSCHCHCHLLQTSAKDVNDTLVHEIYSKIVPIFLQSGTTTSSTTIDHVVILHLGVANTSKSFRLEQYAFNEASFRIPDIEGYQPNQQCVISDVIPDDHHYENSSSNNNNNYTSILMTKARQFGFQLGTGLDLNNILDYFQKCKSNCDTVTMAVRDHSTVSHQKENATTIETTLDATTLDDTVNVTISQDAGRYVCNYTYYTSLYYAMYMNTNMKQTASKESLTITADSKSSNKNVINMMQQTTHDTLHHLNDVKHDDNTTTTKETQKHKDKVQVLFIHVPPLDVCPLENQVNCILRLMNAIESSLNKS